MAIWLPMACSQPTFCPIWARVWGMTRIDEAKITGMTPAVFTRSGRYVFAPP